MGNAGDAESAARDELGDGRAPRGRGRRADGQHVLCISVVFASKKEDKKRRTRELELFALESYENTSQQRQSAKPTIEVDSVLQSAADFDAVRVCSHELDLLEPPN